MYLKEVKSKNTEMAPFKYMIRLFLNMPQRFLSKHKPLETLREKKFCNYDGNKSQYQNLLSKGLSLSELDDGFSSFAGEYFL